MQRAILSVILGLFLIGCGASKNEAVVVDAKAKASVSESKIDKTNNVVDEDEDGECVE